MSTGVRQRRDIQGLRAVAVLLVVAAHAGLPKVEGGYVGVDVFFVISGFLITGILANAGRVHGRVSLVDFYVRRARRILPAAAVVLVAIVIGSAFAYTSGRLHQALEDTVWSSLFAANLHFGAAGTGYFDTDTFVSPLRHFWSLAVEEQFYLVWPLLLGGCALLARRATLRLAVVVIVAVSVASFVWSVHQTGSDPTPAYFSPLTRAWELGLGSALALVSARVARLPAAVRAPAAWAGLAMIGYAALVYSEATAFPGSAALLPVTGSALVLAGGLGATPRPWSSERLLGLAPMQWVGDRSYSLYLWHWPALILPAAYLGRDLTRAESLGLVALAVVLSALSYRFVEEPFRRGPLVERGFLAGTRGRALVLWPVSVALVLGSVGVVRVVDDWSQSHRASYVLPDVDPEPGTVQDDPDPLVNDVGFAAELTRAGHELPEQLLPSLERLRRDRTYTWGFGDTPENCAAHVGETRSQVCRVGAVGSDKRLVVLGDSYMGMWLRPVTELAEEAGWEVIGLLKPGCPPFRMVPFNRWSQRKDNACIAHGAWVRRQVARLQPDRILLSARYDTNLIDTAAGPGTSAVRRGTAANPLWRAAVRSSLAHWRTVTPDVWVIGPTPQWGEAVVDCLGSRSSTMGSCQTPLRFLLRQRARMLSQESASAGVHYVDVLPYLCDEQLTCPIVVRNRIVYIDRGHLTTTYALHLKPALRRLLGFGVPSSG